MRHRARRPVLDRLRSVVAAHRGAAAVVAVLTATAVTGVALTAPGGPDSAPTGSPVVGGQAPWYPPDRTSGSTSSATPDAGTDRERPKQDSSPSPAGPTREEQPAPRSDRSLPTADVEQHEAPAPAPERPTTVTESPAAEAPQTTATTRSTTASRWVIGVGSDTDATFTCSLDGGAYQPCGPTVTYDDLARGTHTFAARATDEEGDTDPSPATLTAEIGPPGRG